MGIVAAENQIKRGNEKYYSFISFNFFSEDSLSSFLRRFLISYKIFLKFCFVGSSISTFLKEICSEISFPLNFSFEWQLRIYILSFQV